MEAPAVNAHTTDCDPRLGNGVVESARLIVIPASVVNTLHSIGEQPHHVILQGVHVLNSNDVVQIMTPDLSVWLAEICNDRKSCSSSNFPYLRNLSQTHSVTGSDVFDKYHRAPREGFTIYLRIT